VDSEVIKLRDLEHVSAILVTHQLRDAFYIATHRAVQVGGRVEFQPVPTAEAHETEFIMLKDGDIAFEGTAEELRASQNAYLRAFLS
jgi:phospholipid/cholesterol/gamma-HCH transport system ATP-binding protein